MQAGALAPVSAEAYCHMSDGSDLPESASPRLAAAAQEGSADESRREADMARHISDDHDNAAEIERISGGRQLVFDFPAPPQEPASFLVTEANRDAARLVGAPQLWSPAACVVGPHGSGKTHLAQDYFPDAQTFPPSALRGAAEGADGLGAAPGRLLEIVGRADVGVVLDNVDEAFESSESDGAERALFHIFNRAAERGAKILLLARTPPARWPVRAAGFEDAPPHHSRCSDRRPGRRASGASAAQAVQRSRLHDRDGHDPISVGAAAALLRGDRRRRSPR